MDVGVEYTAPGFTRFAYRQHPYDDGSLAHRTNLRDGLNGLRMRNRRGLIPRGFQLESVLLEYLYTRHQGGDLFLANARQRGRDNYFNHSQYQDGWSRYGLTMGTPFITPSTDTQPHLPAYGFTNNNRVAVMHLGLGRHASDRVGWQLKASYSQNWGTYEVPFGQRVDQFSSMLSAWSPLGRARATTVTVAIGADVGELYTRSVGFYVGLRQANQRPNRPKG
ncbi:hypothetical protein [Spirosoma arcticum]